MGVVHPVAMEKYIGVLRDSLEYDVAIQGPMIQYIHDATEPFDGVNEGNGHFRQVYRTYFDVQPNHRVVSKDAQYNQEEASTDGRQALAPVLSDSTRPSIDWEATGTPKRFIVSNVASRA